MSEDEHESARRLAATQSRFRDANERLRRIAPGYGFERGDRAPFICECADPDCFESVLLSLDEYDRVRAHPSRFVLVAGHEDDEAPHERVLEAEGGYAIVERIGQHRREAGTRHNRDDGSTD